MAAIVWFRRDLRLNDHPALAAALAGGESVIPFFCLDERLLGGRFSSAARTRFLLESLADLDRSLRERGSALVVRRGNPVTELRALASASGAGIVHATADATPYARARDASARAALAELGVRLVHAPGLFTVDAPDTLRTATGTPHTVFTPFHRSWLAAARREPLAAPAQLPSLPAELGADAGGAAIIEPPGTLLARAVEGGERAARASIDRFLADLAAGYERARNDLAGGGTSRLSPYLHFGCVSPRELESRLPPGPGGAAFRRQLCWRDFFAQVLRNHPRNTAQEFQARYRGTLTWLDDPDSLAAWAEGQTGYPLVDAGMRQLRAEGWMHNRARLVTASFLTKHLGLDWRLGEQHFMRWLLDGDLASNNGNWQWIASVGVDPAPVFKRVLSPQRQQARFDPSGGYVRAHVPELRAVPDRYLAEPWRMPAATQRAAGCVIGADYPAPVVDHATARADCLTRYRTAGRARL